MIPLKQFVAFMSVWMSAFFAVVLADANKGNAMVVGVFAFHFGDKFAKWVASEEIRKRDES